MLNQDKLNRVQRILSAKSGTLVPKFLDPSGPLKLKYLAKKTNTKGAIEYTGFDENGESYWIDLKNLGYYSDMDIYDYDNPEKNNGKVDPARWASDRINKVLEEKLLGIKTDSGQANTIKTLNQLPDSLQKSVVLTEPKNDSDANAFLTQHLNNSTPTIQSPSAMLEQKLKTEKDKDAAANLQAQGETVDAPVSKIKKEELAKGVSVTLPEATPKVETPILEDIKMVDTSGLKKNVNSLLEALQKDLAASLAKKEANWAKASGIGQSVAVGADLAQNLFVDKADFASDDPTQGAWRNTYDNVANSLMAFSPVGTIAGGAMKAIGLINDIGGKKADSFAVDLQTREEVGGSYGGTSAEIDSAAAKAGKKYGLFSSGARRRANREIAEARRKQINMSAVAKEASDRRASSSDGIVLQQALSYERNLSGGYDLRYLRAAKEGVKIQYFKNPFKVELSDSPEFKIELSEIPSIFKLGGTIIDQLDTKHIFNVELSDPNDLQSFKEGGSIKDREIEVIETNTTLKSVIPEGALHKNKHHLNEVGIDDSELTKKGIPVVDNDGDLQAEIELNEIIFTLEVTKEIEARYKEFYEENTSKEKLDELAIETGKLLWKEILYNTDDRTGLIDTLKLGGILKAQEGTEVPDALHVTKPLVAEKVPANDDKKFELFLKSLPDNQRNYSEDTYRMKRYWELNDKPKDFKEALEKGMFTLENDGFYHARSVAYNPELDEYEFMKMPGHKTTWMEEEGWYNGMDFKPKKGLTEEQANGIKENYVLTPKKGRDAEESRRFRERYILDKSGKFWKYIPRNKKVKKELLGGVITQDEINQMVKQALLNLIQ